MFVNPGPYDEFMGCHDSKMMVGVHTFATSEIVVLVEGQEIVDFLSFDFLAQSGRMRPLQIWSFQQTHNLRSCKSLDPYHHFAVVANQEFIARPWID